MKQIRTAIPDREMTDVQRAVISLRRRMRWNQTELGERLGVKRRTVAGLETDRPPTGLRLLQLYRIAHDAHQPEADIFMRELLAELGWADWL